MQTVLTLMLVRFGLIVGGLVVVALIAFGVAVTLKRRGRGAQVRRYAEAAAGYLETRATARPGRGGSRGRLAGEAVRFAARYLDDGQRPRNDRSFEDDQRLRDDRPSEDSRRLGDERYGRDER
ncbi:hypothetical protein ABZ470_23880 [Streptosporangium sp. NPDC020072]|uniref:hypothetical protein n=1 Tax=Streptosporangium sp. NPDC020072 TaxID=3154788 RepID=UPI00342DFF62